LRIASHYAWFEVSIPQPVGGKLPNAWGLYDMIGNVSEWTNDWFANYDTTPAMDPVGPPSGPGRVKRGMGVGQTTVETATYKRIPGTPAYSFNNGGFRCVRRW
jgi:formylglycine-generating enzyme required for sulfatase activity